MRLVAFDGKSVDIYDFLEKFDNMATLAQWQDGVKAQMVSAYIVSDAKLMYQALQPNDRLNFDVVFLIRDYATSKETYRKQFLDRMPKLNESYALFH